MRSISRAIVKRIINAGATLTKIQPVYPPIKSQLEVATEYMEGKVSANWRESGQMAGENKRRGLEKGNYTMSALVNGAVVVIFRCTTKLATIGASNLSLHVKILRAFSKFISPMFQPASLQDTFEVNQSIFDWSNFRPMLNIFNNSLNNFNELFFSILIRGIPTKVDVQGRFFACSLLKE